ncbi:MAG: hypothetical protein ACC619_01610 [Paracoccaceae bacterium]
MTGRQCQMPAAGATRAQAATQQVNFMAVLRLFVLLLVTMWLAPVYAQVPGLPGGLSINDLRNMTPEQAQGLADQMLQQLGKKMGVDPGALQNADQQEQQELLSGAMQERADQMIARIEAKTGMSIDEFNKLSEAEQNALMAARPEPANTGFDPLPLLAAPVRGFPDGSAALPVAADFDAALRVSEPAGHEVLVVVADMAQREIVWREIRAVPFEERLNLLQLSPNPSALIIELIDPETRRVIRRYRPVAAEPR